jgi:hypothetical protein
VSRDNASRKRAVDGYEPRWDLDLEFGQQAELFVTDIAAAISKGMVEVKRDARWQDTGNLYVEYECKRASGWQPSGIATSDALLWVFVLGDTESALIVPTLVLKDLCRHLYRKGDPFRKELTRGSHPTKGIKVPIEGKYGLVQWLKSRQSGILRGAA